MSDRLELRCHKRHAIVIDDNTIEVKCDSRLCGAGPGWTVLHRYHVPSGELISTEKFKNPPTPERASA